MHGSINVYCNILEYSLVINVYEFIFMNVSYKLYSYNSDLFWNLMW